ncbi:MAG: TonB-dependent receptor [Bacteroidia bacterium]|nr:TonB-dependent receptor [Bacteroidia bacterium]
MKRLVSFSLFVALVAILAWGQVPTKKVLYSGCVLGSDGEKIEYATLLLSSESQKKGVISNEAGEFSCPLNPGTYRLTVQCVGYEPLNKTVNLHQAWRDTVSLKRLTQQLKEVVVQASPIERKADRYVLRVPQALSKDGIELLKEAPGVWVSDNGVAINGASGTKVFVDDREIKLSDDLLISYLRSLKSEDISRVEVLPMTGADKDASMQGGVIYIVMRRRMDQGVQGSLSLQTNFGDAFQRYQPMGSLNWHQGKWDWYASGSATHTAENGGESQANRLYQTSKSFSSRTVLKQPAKYGTIRVGSVYAINDCDKIGAEVEYVRNSRDFDSESRSQLIDPQFHLKSHGLYRQNEAYNMYSVTANYLHKLDKRGSVLKVIADYTSKGSNGENDYEVTQQVLEKTQDTLYRSRSAIDYQIASSDLSWKQALWKKTFLDLGVKYTYTGMDDNAYYEGFANHKTWIRQPDYSYLLDYNEHIGAAYLTYSFDWNLWSVNFGGRAEYTQTNDRTNHLKRTYWDWFPHVNVSYAFDQARKWMVTGQYARYIERPAFKALNPNRIQTSDYSYQIGNPSLRPTYINRFSATLVYLRRYTLTVGGNLHRDLIREFAKQDPKQPEVAYITSENHYRENHWFVAATLPLQPVTWFNLTTNFVGVKQCIQMYKGSDFASHYLYFMNANASFFLPSSYTIDCAYSASSRLYSGNSGINSYQTLNLSLRKKWNDGRLVAKVGVNNVFNQFRSYFSHLENYTSESTYNLGSSGRTVQVSLTWSFNKGKKIKKVVVESQSASEKSRLNGH